MNLKNIIILILTVNLLFSSVGCAVIGSPVKAFQGEVYGWLKTDIKIIVTQDIPAESGPPYYVSPVYLMFIFLGPLGKPAAFFDLPPCLGTRYSPITDCLNF